MGGSPQPRAPLPKSAASPLPSRLSRPALPRSTLVSQPHIHTSQPLRAAPPIVTPQPMSSPTFDIRAPDTPRKSSSARPSSVVRTRVHQSRVAQRHAQRGNASTVTSSNPRLFGAAATVHMHPSQIRPPSRSATYVVMRFLRPPGTQRARPIVFQPRLEMHKNNSRVSSKLPSFLAALYY